MKTRSLLLFGLTFGVACKTTSGNDTKPPMMDGAYDKVARVDFNRVAAELALPIFWIEDADNDGALDATELATTWGIGDARLDTWRDGEQFTADFAKAYAQVAAVHAAGHPTDGLDEAERARRALVVQELAQGRPTLVATDFSSRSAEDRAIVEQMLTAAAAIERIHLRQRGAFGLADKIAKDDTASRTLFHRNQGPWCSAPATESNPDCNALPERPKQVSGLYPADIQDDGKFCESITGELADHFAVVEKGPAGKLGIVPYPKAYAEDMGAVSTALRAAADAIKADDEVAFKAYLLAAATSFETNDWIPADEAWSKMNVQNSKWYLRIGPDEVYFEPCSLKAGFHVSFGLINQDSLKWQDKLDPVKNDMEIALAALAGEPYVAREVSFHLPDFVDVVLNAGDSRSAMGATIGQSLPNWGPVANEGRGRTVAMTNFYTDADSKDAHKQQVESIFCAEAMVSFTSDPTPQIMSTVLHEAAHNLGPSHEYKVDGKTDDEAFGGPLASTLEELKAQTSALYFTDWLADKELITKEMADQAHTRDVTWAFGHISRGMYSSNGKPKPYSQLAAIQIGYLRSQGALHWQEDTKAANGQDDGCLEVDLGKFPGAVDKLGREVLGIKARADKAAAMKLVADHVDSDEAKKLHAIIAERWLRSPKASFVYSIRL